MNDAQLTILDTFGGMMQTDEPIVIGADGAVEKPVEDRPYVMHEGQKYFYDPSSVLTVSGSDVSFASDPSSLGTTTFANNINMGPVSVCLSTGRVVIEEGANLDNASKEFWRLVQENFGRR